VRKYRPKRPEASAAQWRNLTSIHVPDELLGEIDKVATAASVSRNRYILDACRDALARHQGEWPEGFFEENVSREDAILLNEATRAMEQTISEGRRSRGAVAL
jgi:metal-responsive CopG/Arc/MetJ family transcriptional regulator